jgi:hypothetical protein
MYAAARAVVIGGRQDGAAGLGLGEYRMVSHGKRPGGRSGVYRW